MNKKAKIDDPKAKTLDLFLGLTNEELNALAATPASSQKYKEARVELMALASRMEREDRGNISIMPVQLGNFTNQNAKDILEQIAIRRQKTDTR